MLAQMPDPVPTPTRPPIEDPPSDDVPPMELPPIPDPTPAPSPAQLGAAFPG